MHTGVRTCAANFQSGLTCKGGGSSSSRERFGSRARHSDAEVYTSGPETVTTKLGGALLHGVRPLLEQNSRPVRPARAPGIWVCASDSPVGGRRLFKWLPASLIVSGRST